MSIVRVENCCCECIAVVRFRDTISNKFEMLFIFIIVFAWNCVNIDFTYYEKVCIHLHLFI